MTRFRIVYLILMLALYGVTAAPAWAEGDLTATALRISGDTDLTRIEIEFNAIPQIEPRLLSAPNRLVLDMPEALFAVDKAAPPSGNLVASFRTGLIQSGRSRIVIALNEPIAFGEVSIVPTNGGTAHIFSMSLKKTTQLDFSAAIKEQLLMTASTAGGKEDRLVNASGAAKKFTLVIDAGHGGIDGGATGENGTIEKEMTLMFANELADVLRKRSNINVFLTRKDDSFIALDERVKIARQLNADLFVSVHADTIRDKSLRGATVYTLSDKASDAVSRQVAQQENLSDAIGGVVVAVEDKNVSDILIDLTRRETTQQSVGFARSTVRALGRKTTLIHNPQRSAGFRVLRAADIPSILVELGYLSNSDDEKQINDTAWRAGVVEELAGAVEEYAKSWMVVRQ